ncbi:type I restriction enzyme M protein [Nitrosomonas oligotropha]|uniref:site-specific DNA-methyltransferase (adenine-specific) n=1 Tax=Nitrosomonas oligotropha TaxID=42354 RepID=A0A2T5I2S5_9PROT|nr:N-6 DNA methylase [Nitrosomonas oligotropha]PTQ78078.1 type I restriction enzyme M protein [Nitrosomonas oligotropha]
MLDSETKRRIDSCRNMLVGRVPNPQSQVEQITIALIYKFMDDMDAEAEALGGKRSFFTAEFAKYGWSKLMAPGIGGFDMLSLYSEAIQKMNENPGVPALFRDIFKNAYLPYRDPETLRSFLKEINSFTYDHSERLGDAFEYLLSVLGSQGDAGMFRTPRHIIDFMVEIIDPKKDESILDPACGTAGFLISSYKHILKHNSKDYQEQQDRETYDEQGVPLELLTLDNPLHYRGDLLTPDDKKRLATNIRGYDISPDMVRLSLVNMYLHGFASPHIDEYDTLTSDEKWNELADVILANPPFMSPKGGIKPHKRFSITATRSEVLFVDYIAEHLTPNGRAAVIVPEGIIFQGGNAYKQLREMLVKQYLFAVISLPAGVFNPYSGVKTSILVLDKRLAKKTDAILFAKIENDGYHLGAQRRPVDHNDLPAAVRNIKGWLESVRNGTAFDVTSNTNLSLVAKEKIGGNGEWNLSGDRYREGLIQSTEYPWIKVGEFVETITPPIKIQKTEFGLSGRFPIIDQSQNQIAGWTNDESALVYPRKPLVIFGDHTCAVKLADSPFAQGADGIKILQTKDLLDPRYLFHVLRLKPLETAGYQRHFSKLKEYEIPLPPLEIQKEIVAEINTYQKIIDGARQVVENYQPRIPIHPDWPMIELSKLCEIEHGFAFKGDFFVEEEGNNLPILLTPGNFLQSGGLYFTEKNTKYYAGDVPGNFRLSRGDLVVVMTDLSPMMKILGMPAIIDGDHFLHNQRIGKIVLKSQDVLKSFLFYAFLLDDVNGRIKREATGSTVRHTSPTRILSVKIPLPSLTTQQSIVTQIETEQRLVNANKELIRIFEDKIKAVINRVWGETA